MNHLTYFLSTKWNYNSNSSFQKVFQDNALDKFIKLNMKFRKSCIFKITYERKGARIKQN